VADDGGALADLLAFLNAAPVGLVQLAPDGRIEMINALSARLLLPVSASRRLDNLFDVLEALAPGLRQQVAASGTAYGPVGDPVRLHLVPADGPPAAARWLSLQLLRLDAQRLMGVLIDATASRAAEEAQLRVQQLEAENRHILAISRFKSQLLATLSHEFRTPLNAIIGLSDLLAAGGKVPDAERLTSYVGHIGNSGRTLLRLVNNMLDLSKAQADGFEFEPRPVQIEPLLQDVVDLLAATAQRKQLQVTVQVGPGLDELQLDPLRLRQVVFNYLDNAIRFTPPGGRVSLRALAQGPEQVRIEVEDTGAGIAPADQPALFDEFSALDPGPGRVRDGAGLGLALVRRLVQAQGGTVGVRSVPGQGSVFHLVLRRVQGRMQGGDPGAGSRDGGTTPDNTGDASRGSGGNAPAQPEPGAGS
jgi:signal transduction histidine kinase